MLPPRLRAVTAEKRRLCKCVYSLTRMVDTSNITVLACLEKTIPGFVKHKLAGFAWCSEFEQNFLRTACMARSRRKKQRSAAAARREAPRGKAHRRRCRRPRRARGRICSNSARRRTRRAPSRWRARFLKRRRYGRARRGRYPEGLDGEKAVCKPVDPAVNKACALYHRSRRRLLTSR